MHAVDTDIFYEIQKLKTEKQAVILAHYYQEPDIQDIADFLGDSLQLSQEAKKTDANVILFAGVRFMAETAKILNPTKRVIIPDYSASCSLVDTCTPDAFSHFINKIKSDTDRPVTVVSYINCSAEIKAKSNIICTSSNAEKIIRSIDPSHHIIFAPDKNLGNYLIKKTGRPMTLWNGSCIVHETFSERKLIELKLKHPSSVVIAHPECEENILSHATFIGSTTALLTYTMNSSATSFIVATESGIIHEMSKHSPNKTFIPALPTNDTCQCNECPYMRLNTIEKVYQCLNTMSPEITLNQTLIQKALIPLEAMLKLSTPH